MFVRTSLAAILLLAGGVASSIHTESQGPPPQVVEPALDAVPQEHAVNEERKVGRWKCDHEYRRARIDVGVRGCFGGSDSAIVIEQSGADTVLFTKEWVSYDTRRVFGPTKVDAAAAKTLMLQFEKAFFDEPPTTSAGCSSTSRVFARVTLKCGDSIDGSFMLETNECGFSFDKDKPDPPPETTAMQIYRWAESVFQENKHAPVTAVSTEEQERIRRKWASLYEGGLRVRHDPIEEWEE